MLSEGYGIAYAADRERPTEGEMVAVMEGAASVMGDVAEAKGLGVTKRIFF